MGYPVNRASKRAAVIPDVIRSYSHLLRIPHYIKNILIFIPLFFSFGFLGLRQVFTSCPGFVIFSLLSSIVYVLNDIQDIEKDRLHTTKRLRPLASGKISIPGAVIAVIILSLLLIALLALLVVRETGGQNVYLSVDG
jgi:4-hydroxybenzoate polyprenyltransferase